MPALLMKSLRYAGVASWAISKYMVSAYSIILAYYRSAVGSNDANRTLLQGCHAFGTSVHGNSLACFLPTSEADWSTLRQCHTAWQPTPPYAIQLSA